MKNATINTQAGIEPVALIDILVALRFWCMIFNGNKFDWFGHALQYESSLKIVPCNMALFLKVARYINSHKIPYTRITKRNRSAVWKKPTWPFVYAGILMKGLTTTYSRPLRVFYNELHVNCWHHQKCQFLKKQCAVSHYFVRMTYAEILHAVLYCKYIIIIIITLYLLRI